MAGPVIGSEVEAYLKLQTPDSELSRVVDAVNSLLITWFGDRTTWTHSFTMGGVMLAARIYRRRNSPAGVESFGEMGPVYVQRNDPDIALMLGLGNYRRPMVG